MYNLSVLSGICLRRIISTISTNKSIIDFNLHQTSSFLHLFSKQYKKCSVNKFQNKWPTVNSSLQYRHYANKSTHASTNVAKDVILYKFDNARYYKALNLFALSQFIFWTYLGTFAYTSLRDAPVDPKEADKLPWYKRINMGETKYRVGLTLLCGIMGNGILGASVWYTTRSIRYLVLRKGGQDISFVTYTPLGRNRIINVPITHVSAQMARETARTMLPIKIHKIPLFYILDMKGEFRNPQLFDATVGLYRNFDILKKH